MRRLFFALLWLSLGMMKAQDTLWLHVPDRFTKSDMIEMKKFDRIEFQKSVMYLYYKPEYITGTVDHTSRTYASKYDYYTFHNPGRVIYKPNEFRNMNFDSTSSRWCFQRSKESTHFIVFWEPGFGLDPMKSNIKLDVDLLLDRAEHLFHFYADSLGFVIPGQSRSTDNYKIEIFVNYDTEWLATGSGYDDKIGALWCTPWALEAAGGHTVGHEIGHSFQYLVSCDLGTTHGWRYGFGSGGSGGCMWWEACAQWQAYKVYPEQQFSNDHTNEYLENCNKNLMHEDWRYANFFIQDYWCMLHGMKFIGKLWRESTRPEDPIEAYKRINGVSQSQFNDEIFNYAQRVCTWDIDGIRERGAAYIDNHSSYVQQVSAADPYTWQIDAAHCVENYGYNIIRVNNAEAGTTIKANFKGIVGASGYRKVNASKAGWRYGFVAYLKDGSRVYGEPHSDAEGVAEFTVPEGVSKMWFVVTGAPTEHWRHAWDDNAANDEQWPYQVRFEGTNVYGYFEDYPADYQRNDTIVNLEVELPYDAYNYSSVVVQYDMEAASRALGLSTKQLKAVKCSSNANPGFFGCNQSNSTLTTNTTTSTSSSTVFGHWFNSSGNVCGYDNSAYIFAEFRPETFKCTIGQYPGHLKKGKTYKICQGIRYKGTGDKKYYTVKYIVTVKVI